MTTPPLAKAERLRQQRAITELLVGFDVLAERAAKDIAHAQNSATTLFESRRFRGWAANIDKAIDAVSRISDLAGKLAAARELAVTMAEQLELEERDRAAAAEAERRRQAFEDAVQRGVSAEEARRLEQVEADVRAQLATTPAGGQ